MKGYTESILAVREINNLHEKELYEIKKVQEYLEVMELLTHDDSVVAIVNMKGNEKTIQKQLEPYTFENA